MSLLILTVITILYYIFINKIGIWGYYLIPVIIFIVFLITLQLSKKQCLSLFEKYTRNILLIISLIVAAIPIGILIIVIANVTA